MVGKPKTSTPKAPDPATVAYGVDDIARRQAELERRRRGGYYSGFRAAASSQAQMTGVPAGGSGEQTLG